jgi:hypothetical protein
MRKVIGVAVLIAALTCPAYSGEMPNGIPSGTPGSAPAEIPNGVIVETTSDVTATGDIQGAELALSLLQSLLTLL